MRQNVVYTKLPKDRRNQHQLVENHDTQENQRKQDGLNQEAHSLLLYTI